MDFLKNQGNNKGNSLKNRRLFKFNSFNQFVHLYIPPLIGARRYKPGWEIRFKYELDGQVFSKSNTISEKQYNSINIGDTIEVLVSLKHPNRRAFWTGASGYLALPSQTELNSIPRKP